MSTITRTPASMGVMTIKHLLVLSVALGALSACGSGPADDHAGDHAHEDERPTLVYTRFTDASELFVELPALVAGEGSRLAAHVTRLADYRPLREGVMEVSLSREGETRARFRVKAPTRAGIFTPVVTPREAGRFRVQVSVAAPELTARFDLGEVVVHAPGETIPEQRAETEGAITFLKEQQWEGGFGTEVAEQRRLRASVYATARLRPPGNRTASVRAPADGVIHPHGDRFPVVGTRVRKGERLGTLRARLGQGVDMASLQSEVEQAQARARLAREDLKRLQGLFHDGAVAAHRVHEAETEARVAGAALESARARLDAYAGGDQSRGVPLIAPISGRIVEVRTAPGEFVASEQLLLQIVADGGTRWLEARIPEADAERLRQPSGAWFTEGGERKALTVGDNARLITAGGIIDPVSRTVPVIFEFEDAEVTPLLGRGVDAQVFTGETVEAIAVPRSAIIDDGGQPVVYVQTGGESFARRPVRLGMRGVDYIAVDAGLKAGERVVHRGAYRLRLAAADPAETGHGHAH